MMFSKPKKTVEKKEEAPVLVVYTNMGFMPVEAFNDLRAQSEGYRDYAAMQADGKSLPQPKQLYWGHPNGAVEMKIEKAEVR